ncbi:hypothetical protein [Cumulibacter soli]|uniref:hypothetical protein n=1 Tax=Cumulibacter soli TaxID=2546344 RepID=UPI001067361F|nr:hypothetical protein [Cumulibacter soli]
MSQVDRTPKPCRHKIANHQHGTRTCYVLDRCRCTPCARAHREYEQHRRKQHAYGRWDNYVDAAPVRAHVRELRLAGMGLKTIAPASGVSHGSLWKLVYGKTRPDGTRTPSRRVTKATAEKLLAVAAPVLADGARVDATGTTRRIQALVAIGWSGARLADRIGVQRSNFTPLLHGTRDVLVATRRVIIDLYEELWDQAPPADERHDRISVSRSKNYAARMGWVPPLAWDDDAIDDPAATPNVGEHVKVTTADRVRELADLGLGVADVARRLGMREAAVERALYRAGAREMVTALKRRDAA